MNLVSSLVTLGLRPILPLLERFTTTAAWSDSVYVQSVTVDLLSWTMFCDQYILSILDILSPCLQVMSVCLYSQQLVSIRSLKMSLISADILCSALEKAVLIRSFFLFTQLKSPSMIIFKSSTSFSWKKSIFSRICLKKSILCWLCAHGAWRFIIIARSLLVESTILTLAMWASFPIFTWSMISIFSLSSVIHPPWWPLPGVKMLLPLQRYFKFAVSRWVSWRATIKLLVMLCDL